MSLTIKSPPQTYSRLFRPWDGQDKSKHNHHHHNQDNTITSTSVPNYEVTHQTTSSDLSDIAIKSACFSDTPIKSSLLQANAFSINERLLKPELNLAGSPILSEDVMQMPMYSNYSDFMSPNVTNPYYGLDPYTISAMEQEYARVLTEEAQAKMISSRKQRPKKFKCPHCDVAFSNNGQLKGHIRIHTGERPFKCDQDGCGKTFTRNEELTRHKRIHSGLRPYPCTTCGKHFGRRDHLKKHTKTHFVQERYLAPTIFLPMFPYLYGY